LINGTYRLKAAESTPAYVSYKLQWYAWQIKPSDGIFLILVLIVPIREVISNLISTPFSYSPTKCISDIDK
jgi:hypothetical protein